MPPEITASRLSRAERVRERRIKVGGLFGILKRCQGPWRRQMSVAPHGSELTPKGKPQADGTLVKALARAWRWRRMLDGGVYATVSEIGDAENISKSYVSRILRLALLAPDIVEAIVAEGGPVADAGEAGAAAAGVLGGAAPAIARPRVLVDRRARDRPCWKLSGHRR